MPVTPENIDSILSLLKSTYPSWEGFRDPAFEKEEIDYKKRSMDKAQELLGKEKFNAFLEAGDFEEIIKFIREPATGTRFFNPARST